MEKIVLEIGTWQALGIVISCAGTLIVLAWHGSARLTSVETGIQEIQSDVREIKDDLHGLREKYYDLDTKVNAVDVKVDVLWRKQYPVDPDTTKV